MTIEGDIPVTGDMFPEAEQQATLATVLFVEKREFWNERLMKKEEKYTLSIEIEKEPWLYIPSATMLARMVRAFGRNEKDWTGKQINLWSKKRNIGGELKSVIQVNIIAPKLSQKLKV